MTSKFSESWVSCILEGAGEKGVAAHAIEEFRQSQRASLAEYWQQNPIRRAADERLYLSHYEYSDESEDKGSSESSIKGSKALAIGLLLTILAIVVKPLQSPEQTQSTNLQNSFTDAANPQKVDLAPRQIQLQSSTISQIDLKSYKKPATFIVHIEP